MLRVFCVNVGDRYTDDYVIRLWNMFQRNLRIPFVFICSTDRTEQVKNPFINFITPARNCWGWWNLQEAYSNPVWAEGNPILYCGLDTIIRGDITDAIVERCEKNVLTYHRDFTELIDNRESVFFGSYADGLTFIPSGGIPLLWYEFNRVVTDSSSYPMHLFNTRLCKESGIVPEFWQDVAPGLICSYKWPMPKLEEPKEPIVIFHGEPRPAQAIHDAKWIANAWR